MKVTVILNPLTVNEILHPFLKHVIQVPCYEYINQLLLKLLKKSQVSSSLHDGYQRAFYFPIPLSSACHLDQDILDLVIEVVVSLSMWLTLWFRYLTFPALRPPMHSDLP